MATSTAKLSNPASNLLVDSTSHLPEIINIPTSPAILEATAIANSNIQQVSANELIANENVGCRSTGIANRRNSFSFVGSIQFFSVAFAAINEYEWNVLHAREYHFGNDPETSACLEYPLSISRRGSQGDVWGKRKHGEVKQTCILHMVAIRGNYGYGNYLQRTRIESRSTSALRRMEFILIRCRVLVSSPSPQVMLRMVLERSCMAPWWKGGKSR